MPIHFVTNHTETREAFNVTSTSDGQLIENEASFDDFRF